MDLPCDGDGLCMVCKTAPSAEETLSCKVCATPWHVPCLSEKRRPETLSGTTDWDCPDCVPNDNPTGAAAPGPHSKLLDAVRLIENDDSLSDEEKARRRQELLAGKSEGKGEEETRTNSEVLALMGQQISCSICMQLPERPVTTPCGHNFCLKCFQKMVAQGKRSCANCRAPIPTKMAKEPRINESLVSAIRAAKICNTSSSGGPPKPVHFMHNQSRPDKAFVTERAKKTGKANACSGKIFVTIPNDHFGPILAENDPTRKRGVLVGDFWEDRMECRQWGAHFPHVAGIAGQSEVGSQSVALSGGYEDDEDHGEWFLYTGSGGRDLSGNKRTNKVQSFDQKFDKSNAALRVSCLKGHPIRVVRSHKEKRSSYAPEKGVRYDGIYRIEKCWRKGGKQGFKMCRYLFVRCDNEPAPWTTDTHGDRPRPLPEIKELKNATDVTTRKASASWDFDEEKGLWLWKKPPPESRLGAADDCDEEGNTRRVKRQKKLSGKEKLLKEFGCLICKKVMTQPLSTPCGHNFCKACLQGAFAGQSSMRQRTREGGRSLRATKNIMACPQCKADVSDFLADPQVNRELMSLIESIQRKIEEESAENGEEAEEPKADEVDVESDDEAGESDADASSEEANGTDLNPELAVEEACKDTDEENLDVNSEAMVEAKDKTLGTVPSLEKKAIKVVAAEETEDKENLDVNSGAAVEAKDKTQGTVLSLEKKAINVVAAEETVDKPATARTTRAKSKMVSAGATSAAADEGKRSKRKTAAEGVLSTSSDGGVNTRSKKGKRV